MLAQKLAALAIIAIAFFVGIDLAGIDLTALAVFSGALGLAVGFGLQKTFGNLIAGIILLMDRSIKPGDVISVGESFGSVNKIGVRAVSIVTRDGKEYLIPNELLMTQEVVNWSYSTRDVRISIPIGIAYDCDVEAGAQADGRGRQRLARACSKRPQPAVWMTKFGENAIEHEIRVWIIGPRGRARQRPLGDPEPACSSCSATTISPSPARSTTCASRSGRRHRRSAQRRLQRVEGALQPGREPRGGGAGRRTVAGDEQGLDPGRGPDHGLGGERVEAALGDRQRADIGRAHPRRRVEPGVVRAGVRPAGDPLDQAQRLAQLRDLAAGIGRRGLSRGRRLMRHGPAG